MPFVQKRLIVVHHGVHTFPLLSREAARRKLAPDLSCNTWIGTIAELHPVKRLDILIQALEHVLPDRDDVGLFIIGEGDERGYLEHLIKVEGLTGRVVLLGHVTDAPSYLSAFDLFVLPSRSESLGYVLLEAGMAGLPAIGTRVGGIPEILEDGVTGLLVPPNDAPALTDAIEHVLNDDTLRRTLATQLHQKVVTQFTPERMLDATFATYQ
jgi:glycosyltransferase involved in cell wall biosynthesis